MRWSRFKHFEPREMMAVVDEHVFPLLRGLGAEGSSYGRHIKTGRRACVIVPDGVLFGSSKAHQALRRMLVEDHKLDADRLAAPRGRLAAG
jgi:hypothetical protein